MVCRPTDRTEPPAMLARVLLYIYAVCFAVGMILDKPPALAIAP